MRVLLVPDGSTGVNMLGVALGYYLVGVVGGNMDVMVSDEGYRALTEANL